MLECFYPDWHIDRQAVRQRKQALDQNTGFARKLNGNHPMDRPTRKIQALIEPQT